MDIERYKPLIDTHRRTSGSSSSIVTLFKAIWCYSEILGKNCLRM